MTKFKSRPETLAEKDVSYIREKTRKLKESGLTTHQAIKQIQKDYPSVSYGRIQWYLKEQADDKREQDEILIKEKIRVEKGKQTEERRKRKGKKNEGIWKLPTTTSKSLELKTNSEQDKILYEHYLEYRSLGNFVKEGEARKKETKTPYDYVKKYRIKNQSCKAHWLGGCINTIVNTVVPSGIRGIFLGKVAFPICGKVSPNTSGEDIQVIKENGKYWLLFAGMKIEILYQNHDEYYSKGIEKPVHEYWDSGVYHGGWIVKAKNGKWYWQSGVPKKPSEYQWDENKRRIYMIIQPILNECGIVWKTKFFNMDEQQVFDACLLHAKSTVRITSKTKDCRLYHVRKAINKVFRIWHERFGIYQPIVILQDTIGKAQSQDIENMNPTYKLQERLKDKLAEVNGMGANISDVKPFDVRTIRSRLSL